MLRNTPPSLTPDPAMFKASSPIVMPPENSRAAPEPTVTPPSVVPRAVLCAALNAPVLTMVAPVYELAPDKISVPVPLLFSVLAAP